MTRVVSGWMVDMTYPDVPSVSDVKHKISMWKAEKRCNVCFHAVCDNDERDGRVSPDILLASVEADRWLLWTSSKFVMDIIHLQPSFTT